MAHSRFSPSATEREYACPASFLLNENFPDRQGHDAAHGTGAHHIGELCLSKGVDTDTYAGCSLAVSKKGRTRFLTANRPIKDDEEEFPVDDEMVREVQRYVDWCRELPGEHHVEVRVEHTDWCPDFDENGEPLGSQYGTSDHNACIPAGVGMYDESTIVVTDLKYGKGLKVFAFENKQAIKYALGAWKEWNWIYKFKRVVIRICQPRLDHFDTWELTVDELLEWGEKIKRRLELVFVEDPPFGPTGKGCKFCKVPRCKALAQKIHEDAAFAIDDSVGEFTTHPALLTDEELFRAYRLLEIVEIRANKIRDEVRNSLMRGDKIGDLQLVEMRKHRAWTLGEDDLVETLEEAGLKRNQMYNKPTLKSPAQIEKELPKEKKKIIADLAKTPAGEAVVAGPNDSRKRYEAPIIDLDGLD